MRTDSTEHVFSLQWRALGLFLLLVGSASAYWLQQNRAEMATRESERLQTQTRVVERNLSSQLDATYRALSRIRTDLRLWRTRDGYTREVTLRLLAMEEALPGVRTLTVLDAKGIIRVASREELVGGNFSHRGYFQAARSSDPGTLLISEPFRTSLGAWVILMAIPIIDENGRFDGIVTATLDPEYFTTLLASVSYSDDFRASIVHGDGTLFINQPKLSGTDGRKLDTPGSMFSRHMASGQTSTVFSGKIALTGEERMMAQRTINPPELRMDKPLIVAISRDLDAVYAPWWRDVRTSALLYLLIVGCNVIGLYLYQQRTRQLNAETRAAHREAQRLAERNQILLDSAGEGIFGVDISNRCMFINPAALALLGFDEAHEVQGKNVHALIHYQHSDGSPYLAADCPIGMTIRDGLQRRIEDVFTRKDGSIVPVQMTITAMKEAGRSIGAEVVFQDISKRREMERELVRLATTDTLTGIANRRRFMEQLGMELERIKRFGKPATLLMLDIDHFKQVNDTYGHAVGDAVLRHFTALTQKNLRRIDLFGRLGGEEFGILLPGTPLDGACEFADRLRQQIADTAAPTEKGPIHVTVSIGAAEFDTDDNIPDSILARADVALYRAKGDGRNRVEAS